MRSTRDVNTLKAAGVPADKAADVLPWSAFFILWYSSTVSSVRTGSWAIAQFGPGIASFASTAWTTDSHYAD